MISREEVFTYAAFFVRTLLVTINLKMGATGRAEKPLIGCRFRGSLWSSLTILQRIK